MAHRLYNSCDYIPTYLSVCVCVLSDCKGGREWTECGGCVWTCTNLHLRHLPCATKCYRECHCPAKTPIWHQGKCIKADRCPSAYT